MSQLVVLLRTFVSLGFLALLAGGGWLGYSWYHQQEIVRRENERLSQENAEQRGQIEGLVKTVEEQAAAIQRLDLALQFVKVTRRTAQVYVVDQYRTDSSGELRTRVRFVEVDSEGEPIAEPKEFVLEGDLLYVDAWVVKFRDEFVEQGDALRGTSLYLFRRLFGEHQKPAEGVAIDTPFERPEAYGGEQSLTPLEREIWTNFWEYANNPEKAELLGIRAAHGEAPSMRLEKGKVYRITLRASDGLTFEPEPVPAVIDR